MSTTFAPTVVPKSFTNVYNLESEALQDIKVLLICTFAFTIVNLLRGIYNILLTWQNSEVILEVSRSGIESKVYHYHPREPITPRPMDLETSVDVDNITTHYEEGDSNKCNIV